MPLVPVENLCDVRGVPYPCGVPFRSILVTGPPGSGKTTLMTRLHGWPDEGYLDLGRNGWWKDRVLAYRPREVHLGLPFEGFEESHAVFDREWLESPSNVDTGRIMIPRQARRFWQRNWRDKFLFDFLLPPPQTIFEIRSERKTHGTHPVDVNLTLDIVQRQVGVFETVAKYLHDQGMKVVVRTAFEGAPLHFT